MKTDTLVTTNKFVADLSDFPHNDLVSVRRDEQYDIEFYSVPAGVYVPAMDEKTGEVKQAEVKYWSIHRGKQVEIVNLHGGYQVVTDDDPRAVYGIATDGDSFDFVRDTPTNAQARGVMVPISTQPLSKDGKVCYYSFDTGLVSEEKTEHSFELNYDFGQFIGIMAGDGWVDSAPCICLADNDGFNSEFVERLLISVFPDIYTTKDVFIKDEPGRYGNTVRHRLNFGSYRLMVASCLKDLIDGHGDENTSGSANKRLPQWFQLAPRSFILGLVNGLIATDGSISISNAKDKPQLEISFGSTSLRLVREFRRCCNLLGANASICYSKTTSADNGSWQCPVSTVDAKRLHLFDNLCHIRKRDIFLNTKVEMGAAYIKANCVPFPVRLVPELLKDMEAPKCNEKMKELYTEEEYAKRRHLTTVYVNVHQQNKGRITRSLVEQVCEIAIETAAKNAELKIVGEECLKTLIEKAKECPCGNRDKKTDIDKETCDTLMEVVDSVANKHESIDGISVVKEPKSIVRICKLKGFITLAQANKLLEFIEHRKPRSELLDNPVLKKLQQLTASDVKWTWIDSIEKTGKVETGYDLTVPGYETFMSDEGVILSNTVNFHVPVSDKAVRQANEKMMPSENLISLTDLQSARHPISKEQILGLFNLTQPLTNKPVKVFRNKEEAKAAYARGEIGMNDPIEVMS